MNVIINFLIEQLFQKTFEIFFEDHPLLNANATEWIILAAMLIGTFIVRKVKESPLVQYYIKCSKYKTQINQYLCTIESKPPSEK